MIPGFDGALFSHERKDALWIRFSMWIGNLMLVVINLPLIGAWVQLLRVSYRYLFPAILLLCSIGVYSVNNAASDIWIVVAFGALGYVLIKADCEPAPLLLGFVLRPLLEENFRRALIMSRGDFDIFTNRPISLALLVITVTLLAVALLPSIRRKRTEVFAEGD